jgi:hypothetical protein
VLNLNVGPRMPLHLSTDPAAEPAHWFVLDLAILREHGLALVGPPAAEVVAPIPRPWLLAALTDALTWHTTNEPVLHQTVLNATRAWRYAAEGVWSSKDAAAGWAQARTEEPHAGPDGAGHPPRRPLRGARPGPGGPVRPRDPGAYSAGAATSPLRPGRPLPRPTPERDRIRGTLAGEANVTVVVRAGDRGAPHD